MAAGAEVLSLYRSILRAASAFPDYNVRAYALRTTRARFREQRGLGGAPAAAALADARAQLALVRRQGTIAGMYRGEDSVMEAGARGPQRGVMTR
jgi:hypothetical protein